ncbi:MAG TPA: hypothetical protein EYQ73_03630 [Candidatus Poseidoniales archaeon]|jgi:hypothetical protein|nr:MAG: hypothetical protein CXT71_06310 [Euryarchaeota archaeon]HIF45871.1 hypothetical protein [Candidatus Poseidoniales archaeon]HIL65016.1 hypothetical protein [Candidatus Poseidoniales archaeon]
MRFLRALIIGTLCFFPTTIIGYLGWLATGSNPDNYSVSVIFFCNIIPLGGMIFGGLWAWRTGEEYSVEMVV